MHKVSPELPTQGGRCARFFSRVPDAVTKICTLPLLAGDNISSAFVVPTVASCIDLVVHCSRHANGRRQVTEILSLGRRVENGIIESSMVFELDGGQLAARANSMPAAEKFARAGY